MLRISYYPCSRQEDGLWEDRGKFKKFQEGNYFAVSDVHSEHYAGWWSIALYDYHVRYRERLSGPEWA